MTRPVLSNVKPKLRKLAHLASELRRGRSFNITRLTTIKSFCDDPDAATRFALFLAQQAQAALEQRPRPEYIPEERWAAYRRLTLEAIRAMDTYLEARTEAGSRELVDLRRALEQLQNQHQSIPFGVARVIENQQALIVETALRIVLAPTNAADWGYQIARMYAERYDSRYGTGLIPDSAQAVETIVDFWCRHYCGVTLDEWASTS
ncbi:MAG TPA: hypothetical protein VLA19_28400 [Herpetosiphonaceae bacterium]|nr:hypothetical protein [Herpetosiphonaceae bacterium]